MQNHVNNNNNNVNNNNMDTNLQLLVYVIKVIKFLNKIKARFSKSLVQ